MSATDAGNRAGLALVGGSLLAAGGLGLAVSFGAFGSARASAPVLSETTRQFAASHWWFWPAVCGIALLVGLLALRWLIAQTHTDRTSRIDRSTDPRDGRTILHSGALADAVEDDAQAIPGVLDASAHVTDPPTALNLQVDLLNDADIAAVRHLLETRTVVRARAAIAQDDLPVRIELRPGKSGRARVLA
jgi:hypothetical protein